MDEILSRNGHRERMRKQYLSDGFEGLPDHNVLELFLSIILPRKDVKPIAYELINTFGSLENIINANIYDLMKVNGIGETAAIEIKLISDINARISANRNKGVKTITTTNEAISFCKNMLENETVEQLLVITLNNKNEIINARIAGSGTVNGANLSIREIVELAIRDNASGILISHNHPNGKPNPSLNDINFTINLKSTLAKLHISFYDHIIVAATGCISMKQNPEMANLNLF